MGQICLLPLARSAEASKTPELSPARHRLRQAIAILATAQPGLETVAALVERLDAALAEANQLKRAASAASSRKRSRARSMGRGRQRRCPAATIGSAGLACTSPTMHGFNDRLAHPGPRSWP